MQSFFNRPIFLGQTQKPHILNAKDSGTAFSMSVIVVLAVSVVFTIVSQFVQLGVYAGLFLIQLCFLAVSFVFMQKSDRHDFFPGVRGANTTLHFVLSAVIGLTLMFACLFPAHWFELLLEQLGYIPPPSTIPLKDPSDIVPALFFVAVMPAICEELLFRGVILNGLRRQGDGFAITVSALLFMLMHQNPQQTIFPFLSGLVMGLVLVKTGNLIFPMLIHFANNTLAILSEYYELTAYYINGEVQFIVVLAGVGMLIMAAILIYYFKRPSLPVKEEAPCKVIIHDNYEIMHSYGRLVRPDPNEYLEYVRNNPLSAQQNGQSAVSGAPVSANRYEYDARKNAFYLQEPTEQESVTPPLFKDVSDSSYFNPASSGKTTFWLYALTGIGLSAVFWLIAFFSNIF